jgi:excisionase family DNA binding protein
MSKDKDRDVEQYLSTGELMDMLGISRSTVYRLIEKGMPNIMVGSVHRFPKDQLLSWLRARNGKQRIEKIQQATRN